MGSAGGVAAAVFAEEEVATSGDAVWAGSAVFSSSGVDFGEPLNAWYFGMPSGGQRPQDKTDSSLTAWAVVSGDVSVVPVPAAVWLFGSALGALGLARRRA